MAPIPVYFEVSPKRGQYLDSGDYFYSLLNSLSDLIPQGRSSSFQRQMCSRIPVSPVEKKLVHENGKDEFQVCMDVQHFHPKELSVKVVERTVIVEGKHEEKEDDQGIISRQFTRKFVLPEEYDSNDVVTSLSSDGVLVVKCPKVKKTDSGKERVLEIQQTGPAHLNVKSNEEVSK
ncbi:CRYAB.2 family protein [Megaselia abdita]